MNRDMNKKIKIRKEIISISRDELSISGLIDWVETIKIRALTVDDLDFIYLSIGIIFKEDAPYEIIYHEAYIEEIHKQSLDKIRQYFKDGVVNILIMNNKEIAKKFQEFALQQIEATTKTILKLLQQQKTEKK